MCNSYIQLKSVQNWLSINANVLGCNEILYNILEKRQDFSIEFSSAARFKGACPSVAMNNSILFTSD